MAEHHINLTPTEWNLMECLWEKAPCTGREAVECLKKKMGWTRSTTLTLLRRMSVKGIVQTDDTGDMRTYTPLIQREDALKRETNDFLNRVYKGSVSMMMSAITQKLELPQEEIDKLYTILKQAEEANSND